jgi:hypothetical protein
MPATQRGQAYKLSSGKWGLRYYDADGKRRRKTPFASKSAALKHYRDVIEPRLRGEPVPLPELTLAELVELYLERHATGVRPRTIATLRDRLTRRIGLRGRPAARPRADDERDRGLAGAASAARGARHRSGAPAGARRGRPVGADEPEPGEARWP